MSSAAAHAGRDGRHAFGGPQLGLFEEELAQARRDLAAREEALRRARQASFEAKKARVLADTSAWQGGEFAERIEALLGQLQRAGPQALGMHDAILGGINSAAKAARLDERHVAFVEEKARVEVARVSTLGQVIPVVWETRNVADIRAMDAGAGQLPLVILDAAIVRMNDIGQGLAKLGFKSEVEVDSGCAADARTLKRDLNDVQSALMLLAVNRYRDAKGYRNAKAENLDRMEQFATQVLGIDTKTHPGVAMDLPLTSGGVRNGPVRKAGKAGRSLQPEEMTMSNDAAAMEAPKPPPSHGICIGKVTKLDGDRIEQKIGRDPRDLVVHDRGAISGDEVAVGDVVTIIYEMGVGRLSNHEKAFKQHGIGR